MPENLSEVVMMPRCARPAGRASPEYRAYAVGPMGHPRSFVEVEAEDDAEAIRLIRLLAEFYPVELWRQDRAATRFLGRFTPDE